jgi:hypothetical protein
MFLPANLHSKEDLAREESVSACRCLALQCSDAGALEGLLQHLFDVFHGSEGKLTVATHKMSVLQVRHQFLLSVSAGFKASALFVQLHRKLKFIFISL